MKAINPTTEELIREYPDDDASTVERRLNEAAGGFERWRKMSFQERGGFIRNVASILRKKSAELSKLMTLEMGKPITGAEAEIEKCAVTCEYFAENAQKLLAQAQVATDASKSYVRFDPLGPVLAIMPWNFPFWQVFRFAAPSLMAGNVAVLKHAWNVPGCAQAIESLFRESEFPSGVFTNLLISNEATEALIAHPVIQAVTLTGSERAGRAVSAAAGRVLKKSVLELGGSDPFIILTDVDPEKIANDAAAARCINSGQSCIAAKRFFVHESIAQRFEQAFAQRMARMHVGDPLDRKTEIGPMARKDLLENLETQVQKTISQGARLLTGGRRVSRRGFFYEPTVLADVSPGMIAFDDETFGPVSAVARYKTVDEAIELANRSRYGLAASIWTSDVAAAEHIAGELQAGCVFVNGTVKSDARMPFGGIKNSGYGRELGKTGIREFVNIKTVWIK